MAEKLLYIVGGPNGAGKTTFAEEFLRVEELEYFGADKIAAELSPTNPAAAAIEAGREFLIRTDQALAAGRNCIIESTLSGRSLLQTIRRSRELKYEIAIQFVYLESAESSLARVRERVLKGGHDVPEVDVRRRFPRALRNFWTLYRQRVDRWNLAYNDSDGWLPVAFGTTTEIAVLDESYFHRFLTIAEASNDQ